MRVVGAKPRPRALLVGFDEASAAEFRTIFPTIRALGGWSGEYEYAEWDVIITTCGLAPDVPPHLFVLAFGQGDLARARCYDKEPNGNHHVNYSPGYRGTEFAITPQSPEDVVKLLGDVAAIELSTRSTNPVLHENAHNGPPNCVSPFCLGANGQIVAGRFRRSGDLAECWAVPHVALADWARAAVHAWSEESPDRFPPQRNDWATAPEWMTPVEKSRLQAMEDIEQRRQRLLIELDAETAQASGALADAREESDRRERALLTKRGDDLVAVVETFLTDCGFEVRNMDQVYPLKDRREDLQLSAVDRPGWLALVEVRGYSRGAQLSDLMRLTRFSKRHLKDTSTEASALWYVVSQLVDQSPDAREAALASNPDELTAFAEDGGMVVDTADLFRMWVALQSEELSPSDARTLLASVTGRFTYRAS